MLTVRPELPEDYPTVFEINTRAFGRSEEARLVEELRCIADPQISLVAVRDDHVVGHIFFSPVTIAGQNSSVPALGLAPMAVVPELQNQGIGSLLVQAGLKAASGLEQGIVVVLGHPHYYPQFGFEIASHKGLQCEFPVPDEAFMVAELRPGALHGLAGIVTYLPEFSRV